MQIWLPAFDLVPFFQRRLGSYCAKLARIWSGWPDQVLAKRIWSGSKPVCKNHQEQFWQNATGLLPVSHFQTLLHSSTDGPDLIVQCQPRSDFVLADCVRFYLAKWIWYWSKPACKIRWTLPGQFRLDADQIRQVHWVCVELCGACLLQG